ncbi:MAG: hypothetical protein JWO76_920 [Nocardioides sp.]|nr:hypothetical protein [Nocardioides sp.]
MRQLLLTVLVACLLASCDGSADDRPSPPLTADPAPQPPSLVLGPRGVGALRLGMTAREVAGTGTARSAQGSSEDGWSRGCHLLFYRPNQLGRTAGNTLNGTVSARQGLEQLYATHRMVTPEGIGIGSTLQDVRAAYDRPGVDYGDRVTVRASRLSVYRIQLDREVTSIVLELRRVECGR